MRSGRETRKWGPLCLNFLAGTPCSAARSVCAFGRHLVAGHAALGAWLCLRKVGGVQGFGGARSWAPAGRAGGPTGFHLLFALQGVLGSGAVFPVLGNCPRRLPAAVGQHLPPLFAFSRHRALSRSAPQASPPASFLLPAPGLFP